MIVTPTTIGREVVRFSSIDDRISHSEESFDVLFSATNTPDTALYGLYDGLKEIAGVSCLGARNKDCFLIAESRKGSSLLRYNCPSTSSSMECLRVMSQARDSLENCTLQIAVHDEKAAVILEEPSDLKRSEYKMFLYALFSKNIGSSASVDMRRPFENSSYVSFYVPFDVETNDLPADFQRDMRAYISQTFLR